MMHNTYCTQSIYDCYTGKWEILCHTWAAYTEAMQGWSGFWQLRAVSLTISSPRMSFSC